MKEAHPIAFQALTAKLVDLAEERKIRITEVAEIEELSAAARLLLTRAETVEIIEAEVERIAEEFLHEGVTSGRITLVDPERGVYRTNHQAS